MKQVILGVGAAGMTAAKELRDRCPEAEITMISLDEQVHSRCMLHKYLSDEREESALCFVDANFFETHRIEWIKQDGVERVEPTAHRVQLTSGKTVDYDRLLIATGANSFIPPIGDFRTASNVFGLRHLADAKAIRAQAQTAQKILIVGSGLVGLDAAYGLLELGKEVTVVEMAPRILPIQLDEHAANVYQKRFETAGCRFVLGRKAEHATAEADGHIREVRLDDGQTIACDLIIVAAGVRPAFDFLEGSGICVDKRVVVDDHLRTNFADVYAAGDVTGLSGIWPNAMKQGKIAAENMCGGDAVYEDSYALKNTINFFGLASLCIGAPQSEEGEVLVQEDRRVYRRAVVKDGKLKSMLLQGDLSHAGIWQYLIKHQVDLSGLQKPIFSLSFADFYGIGEQGTYQWSV